MPHAEINTLKQRLLAGAAIPAHPLALTAQRKLDERRQRALTRYYLAAGAGGVAVGVHTTQFAIRNVGLLEPVLTLAAEEVRRHPHPVIKVAGVCGPTGQAAREAALARDLGYDVALLSLAALADASIDELMEHANMIADVIPVMGFYLQPAVGGRVLPFEFWTRFAAIENVLAIKVAPFNRYQTLEVIRAVAASGRADDLALYTGNDDNIVHDLLGRYRININDKTMTLGFVGGLLGQWSVWTRPAVQMLQAIQQVKADNVPIEPKWLCAANEITDINAAFFDTANGFAGCIAGLHEILRRQGILAGRWCLDPDAELSPGQLEQIDRVHQAYPHWCDDEFVAAGRDAWLRG